MALVGCGGAGIKNPDGSTSLPVQAKYVGGLADREQTMYLIQSKPALTRLFTRGYRFPLEQESYPLDLSVGSAFL